MYTTNYGVFLFSFTNKKMLSYSTEEFLIPVYSTCIYKSVSTLSHILKTLEILIACEKLDFWFISSMDSLCSPLLFPWIQVTCFNSLFLNQRVNPSFKILVLTSQSLYLLPCNALWCVLVVYEDISTNHRKE